MLVDCRVPLGLAVLELRESGDLQKLHKRWWYDKGECAPENEGKVRQLEFLSQTQQPDK